MLVCPQSQQSNGEMCGYIPDFRNWNKRDDFALRAGRFAGQNTGACFRVSWRDSEYMSSSAAIGWAGTLIGVLSRVHGEAEAQQALVESHETLISEVLRTPLRKLMEDAEAGCVAQEQQPSVYLQELSTRSSSLLPDDMGGGSSRHFSSVLHALSALARSQQRATPPDA